MISYIKGKIERTSENLIVVETPSGLGYDLVATSSAIEKYGNEKDIVKIETYLQVREDAMILFGFSNINEKNMFLKLITVSGVGPKLAITILSGTEPSSLALAILTGDISYLSGIKGLGKKTSEKIIVELREKVGRIEDIGIVSNTNSSIIHSQNIEDAAFALCSLGISKTDAFKFASKFATPEMSAEEIIKKCLRNMGK